MHRRQMAQTTIGRFVHTHTAICSSESQQALLINPKSILCKKHWRMELIRKLPKVTCCVQELDAHLNAGVGVELLNNASSGVGPGHILLHAAIVGLQATS